MALKKNNIAQTHDLVETDLDTCLSTLIRGGLILYPTDTVWGIGCDATNQEAVNKVYTLKKRADSKALIMLLDSADKLDHYVIDVPDIAYDLIEVAIKPLTIIYEGAFNLPPNVLGPNDSAGIRIPQDQFCQELCRRLGRPIVSTSANVSGEPTATIFADISNSILQGVDYVVQYRRNDHTPHQPSSIIRLNHDGTFKIIR